MKPIQLFLILFSIATICSAQQNARPDSVIAYTTAEKTSYRENVVGKHDIPRLLLERFEHGRPIDDGVALHVESVPLDMADQ